MNSRLFLDYMKSVLKLVQLIFWYLKIFKFGFKLKILLLCNKYYILKILKNNYKYIVFLFKFGKFFFGEVEDSVTPILWGNGNGNNNLPPNVPINAVWPQGSDNTIYFVILGIGGVIYYIIINSGCTEDPTANIISACSDTTIWGAVLRTALGILLAPKKKIKKLSDSESKESESNNSFDFEDD